MIAANDDGCAYFTVGHHLVEAQAGFGPLAVAEPTDAGGQPLKGNPLFGHFQPSMKVFILREQFHDGFIGSVDIFGIAG